MDLYQLIIFEFFVLTLISEFVDSRPINSEIFAFNPNSLPFYNFNSLYGSKFKSYILFSSTLRP